jgi:hypothetical protein
MNDLEAEWSRKGATLSDKTAQKEFGLTRDEIIRAIRSGALHCREMSNFGNPWFRLLRREVEALVERERGGGYLVGQRMKAELARIDRELKRLKAQIIVLEKQKAKLLT